MFNVHLNSNILVFLKKKWGLYFLNILLCLLDKRFYGNFNTNFWCGLDYTIRRSFVIFYSIVICRSSMTSFSKLMFLCLRNQISIFFSKRLKVPLISFSKSRSYLLRKLFSRIKLGVRSAFSNVLINKVEFNNHFFSLKYFLNKKRNTIFLFSAHSFCLNKNATKGLDHSEKMFKFICSYLKTCIGRFNKIS